VRNSYSVLTIKDKVPLRSQTASEKMNLLFPHRYV
jgi:hypothetical protein